DAVVKPKLLRRCLEEAVSVSFNRITVDGDTSTNDACTLVATGKSEVAVESSADIEIFTRALIDVCAELARQLIHDAEGATKFITIEVNGGRVIEECEQVAFTVAHSPLVKTAFFASDANWGRILAAVGRAGLKDLVVDDIDIFLGDVCIVHQGGRAPDYSEEAGSRVMAEDAIRVRIELKRGDASATVWTSDLSHEYIRINAEYRT
ncbi:MAG TPA: bifunctional ornithine acetyltransferase/N-acetylglutamate synthase, partial [Gammaproteobacteria bacterium]|nr:bifunctional ornithine acetyltransferase/N-acetylglutamate synthase [Gammaproteobacteria bacterium]